MSEEVEDEEVEGGSAGSKKKLLIIILPVLLLLIIGGGIFFERDKLFSSGKVKAEVKKVVLPHMISLDVPEMISNLDSEEGHPVYVKLKVRLEVLAKDSSELQSKLYVVNDILHTYLHETQRADIAGDGIYRLREALLRRLRIEFAPLRVENLYFIEFLVQ